MLFSGGLNKMNIRASAKIVGATAGIGLVWLGLLYLTALSHRPAWGAAGAILSGSVAVSLWRDGPSRQAWILPAFVLIPLVFVILVDLIGILWNPTLQFAVLLPIVGVGLWYAKRAARLSTRAAGVFAFWLLALGSPIELSFISSPNGPRAVPLAMGLLSESGNRAVARGELVGGGCIASGIEPRWVVVW